MPEAAFLTDGSDAMMEAIPAIETRRRLTRPRKSARGPTVLVFQSNADFVSEKIDEFYDDPATMNENVIYTTSLDAAFETLSTEKNVVLVISEFGPPLGPENDVLSSPGTELLQKIRKSGLETEFAFLSLRPPEIIHAHVSGLGVAMAKDRIFGPKSSLQDIIRHTLPRNVAIGVGLTPQALWPVAAGPSG
ncbi:MAG: hypothetical protein KGI37_00095 [Alphaproteobacteria bacterium]|nr:hypothetical protein [Alphaproteobacteria bacterium]